MQNTKDKHTHLVYNNKNRQKLIYEERDRHTTLSSSNIRDKKETPVYFSHQKKASDRGAVILGEFRMFMNIKSKPKYKLNYFISASIVVFWKIISD